MNRSHWKNMPNALYNIAMNENRGKQGKTVISPSSAQLRARGAMNCPKCNSTMDEASHDSIRVAECYFCGFRLMFDEHEEENVVPCDRS